MTTSRVRERFEPATYYPTLGKVYRYGWEWYKFPTAGAYVLRGITLVPGPGMVTANWPALWKERTIDELHAGPPYLTGGPFDRKYISENKWMPLIIQAWSKPAVPRANKYYYIGGWCPIIPGGPLGPVCTTELEPKFGEWGDVSSHGPTAYAKFSPLKPAVNVGETLAELSQLPRMLSGSAAMFYKIWNRLGGKKHFLASSHVANEWLNTQFGWKPFLSTLGDFCKTQNSLYARMTKLRKNNGKWVKRGGRLFETINSEDVSGRFGVTNTYPEVAGFNKTSSVGIELVERQRCWFSAKYKYWIPELNGPVYSPKLIAHLYGARLTPSLVWNLLPWSWMIDWGVNLSAILQNVDESSFGQLVSQQAFIMGRTEKLYKITARITLGSSSQTGIWESSLTRKTRTPASPYGFDVRFQDLSPWKVSILSALGISKRRSPSELNFLM